MTNIKYLTCVKCKKQYEASPDRTTCSCGGVLEVVYDYDYISSKVDKKYFETCKDYTMWRYKYFLPINQEDSENSNIQVGYTPLYNSNKLAKKLGIKELYIKDDGRNPTASLKDRASAIGVYKAKENKKEVICCSSTGNAASSLAGNAAAEGLKSVIFVPKRAPLGKIAQLLVFGAKVFSVDGCYEDAFEMSQMIIDKYGFYNRNAAINPYLMEGKKTVSLEIAEQLNWNVTDYVAVSVGDGCTIAGVWKGFKELHEIGFINKVPQLISVQAYGCSPISDTYNKLNDITEDESLTIADSIAVGQPKNMTKAIWALQESNAVTVEVSNQEIYEAIYMLGSECGVFAEPSSAVTLAGIKKLACEGKIDTEKSITMIVTGNGLKDIQAVTDSNIRSTIKVSKDENISSFDKLLKF